MKESSREGRRDGRREGRREGEKERGEGRGGEGRGGEGREGGREGRDGAKESSTEGRRADLISGPLYGVFNGGREGLEGTVRHIFIRWVLLGRTQIAKLSVPL